MNRSVLVLYLGQRYPRHRSSFGRNGGLNERWKSWFQRKPQSTNLIRPYHTSQYPSRESRLMALELKRQGDFRNVDDLSDFEFNDLYLDAMSGSLEFMVDTATKTSIPQSSAVNDPGSLSLNDFDINIDIVSYQSQIYQYRYH